MKPHFTNTLLFSIVFHLLAGSVFIFTFRPRSEPRRPAFTFLGSILQRQDVDFQEHGGGTRDKFRGEDRSLDKTPAAFQQPGRLDKPAAQKRPEFRDEKTYLKTASPEAEENGTGSEESPASPQNSPEAAPEYIPLRTTQ